MKIERRYFQLRSMDKSEVTGFVAKWGVRSNIGGGFTESFDKDSLKPAEGGVALLVQHDPSLIIGRSGANMSLQSTESGMELKAKIPETRLGQDTKLLLKEKILRGLSAGFYLERDDWNDNHRIVKRAILSEVSLVSSPAHQETEVNLRHKTQTKEKWFDLILGL